MPKDRWFDLPSFENLDGILLLVRNVEKFAVGTDAKAGRAWGEKVARLLRGDER
jgi:hypothetical protein